MIVEKLQRQNMRWVRWTASLNFPDGIGYLACHRSEVALPESDRAGR